LKEDKEQNEYLLRNIEPLCQRVSELERESTKAEWDFRDRKFARWAEKHINEEFKAHVVEVGENAKAVLECEVEGISVNLRGDNVMLFDKIIVKIDNVNLAMAKIQAEFVAKREREMTEL
jgi:ribonuclease R